MLYFPKLWNSILFAINRYAFDKTKNETLKIWTRVTGAQQIIFGQTQYVLAGFSEHLGENVEGGHFIAYRDNLVFDDNGGASEPEVSQLSSSEMATASERGYVFLYKRKRLNLIIIN